MQVELALSASITSIKKTNSTPDFYIFLDSTFVHINKLGSCENASDALRITRLVVSALALLANMPVIVGNTLVPYSG